MSRLIRVRTPRRPGAFMLVEAIMLVAFLVAVMAMIARFVVDALYMQRVTAQRLDRAAMVDHLLERLRADAATASSFEWDGPGCELTLNGPMTPPADPAVRYGFSPDRVTRREGPHETSVWRADRLSFAARRTTGRIRDLLSVTCREAPPERATALPIREFELTVILPAAEREPAPAAPAEDGR